MPDHATQAQLDNLEEGLQERIESLQEDFDEQIELIVSLNSQITQLAEMQLATSAALITYRETSGTQIAALMKQVDTLTIDLHTYLGNAA